MISIMYDINVFIIVNTVLSTFRSSGVVHQDKVKQVGGGV